MQIENQFELPLPPALAWPLLMNVPDTAACFPGASQIEQTGAGQFRGRVTVKLGPMTLLFAGNLHIAERDDAVHNGTVKANWTETKGRGNANTVTHFALQPHGEGTLVTMTSDLQLAGQVAQYGRGVGMISAISAQLISIFAGNICARLHTSGGGETSPPQTQGTTEISGLTLIAKALGNRITR